MFPKFKIPRIQPIPIWEKSEETDENGNLVEIIKRVITPEEQAKRIESTQAQIDALTDDLADKTAILKDNEKTTQSKTTI